MDKGNSLSSPSVILYYLHHHDCHFSVDTIWSRAESNDFIVDWYADYSLHSSSLIMQIIVDLEYEPEQLILYKSCGWTFC